MVRAEQGLLPLNTGRRGKSNWRFLRNHGGRCEGSIRQIQTNSNQFRPIYVARTARLEAETRSRDNGGGAFLPSQTRFNLANFRIGFLVLFPLGVATLPLP